MADKRYRCPMTGDLIQVRELATVGKTIQCQVSTGVWTSGVIEGKTKALKWISEVCMDPETFLDGAEEVIHRMKLSPNPDEAGYVFIRSPKHGWRTTIQTTVPREVWYALTKRPEYAPPKLEVTRDETDYEYSLDDANSDMKEEGDPDLEELLDHAKSLESNQ